MADQEPTEPEPRTRDWGVPPEPPIEPPPRGFSPGDPHAQTARFAGGLARASRDGSRKQRMWLAVVVGVFGVGLLFVLLAAFGLLG